MGKVPPPNAVSKFAPPPVPVETKFPTGSKAKVAMEDGREFEVEVTGYDEGTQKFVVMWREGNVTHLEHVSIEQLTRIPTPEENEKVVPFTRGRVAKNLPPPVPPSLIKTTAVPPPAPKSEAELAMQEILAMNTDYQEIEKRIQRTEILDGAGAKSLYDGRKTYDVKNEKTNSVLNITAATYEGFGYSKGHNEDGIAIYIDPDDDTITAAVGDGMGAGKNSKRATKIILENLKKFPPLQAVKNASKQMRSEGLDGKKDGACFLSVDVKVNEPLKVVQAGDVDLFHFDYKGDYKFRPLDRLKMKDVNGQPMLAQSAFEFFMSDQYANSSVEAKYKMIEGDLRATLNLTDQQVTLMKTRAANNEPLLYPEEPLYYTLRSRTGNAITSAMCEPLHYKTESEVRVGDIVILMSDGVSTNFTESELKVFVVEIRKRGLTAEEATKFLSDELHERMKKADKTKNRFKRDNASIVVIFVNELAAQEKKQLRAV